MIRAACALVSLVLAASPSWPATGDPASGDGPRPPYPQVGIDQRLGERVPLDLPFRDEAGRAVRLRDLMGGRPAILSLAYYRCPMLCGLVQEGLASSLEGIGLRPGRDYSVITVSIDPDDTPEQAAATRDRLLSGRGAASTEGAWRFLTGEPVSIELLAGAAGFRYQRDPATGQYAHGSGIMILTPEGMLAQYFFGIEFAPRDLRLALVGASSRRVGTLVDRLMLLCYRYDPATGRYGAMTYRLVRVGGVLTVIGLASFVTIMLRRETRRARRHAGGSA